MRHKLLLLCMLQLVISSSVYGQQNWTSWSKPPAVLSIAFEDSIVWCGTENEGVIAYNKVTGEQQRYTTENGLMDNIVYCAAVDYKGVKWFGTYKGVSQFDGTQWISHPGNQFTNIVIDQSNLIWAVNSRGIYKYDGNSWKIIKAGDYHSIDISQSGIVWAAGNNRIIRVKDTEILEIDIHEIVAARDYIKDIAIDERTGLLWYACTSKIYSYDFENEVETIELDESLHDYAGYTMIDIDSIGNVWLGRSSYIALYRDGVLTNYNIYDLNYHTIKQIAIDDNGSLWMATSQGLLSLDGHSVEIKFDDPELYSSHIASLVIDNDDTVWCSHMSEMRINYLSYFKDGKWSIGPMGMYSLRAVDDRNVLWGARGKLYAYDGKEVIDHTIIVPIPGFDCDTTSPGDIRDIHIEENGIIWIASVGGTGDCTNSGIFTYEGETVVYQLRGDFSSMTMDSKKNVWCGARWDGLYNFDGNEWVQYTELDGLPGNSISNVSIDNVEVDRNDIVWINVYHRGGENTLGSYDGNSFTEYTAENSGLLKARINSIAIDYNNTKWIGTDAGVSRFDGETWTTFNTQNSGLCDNKVNAIAVETNNTIWFGTDNGVSKYTGEVITTSVDEGEDEIPEAIPVLHSYPNPFNPSTTIEFTLPESGFTTLTIYNISGQKVRELAAGYMTAGAHSLTWDGKDDSGDAVSSGIYITRLLAGKQIVAGRMLLLK